MAQTNDLVKRKNAERQRRFWANKSPEEKRRLQLRYRLNTVLNAEKRKAADNGNT